MREYRRVPALESGSKLSNPDLQDIGEKNYTDIILRYGNLTTKFPQLNTNAKTVVAAINELYAHPGGSVVIPNPPIDGRLESEAGSLLESEDEQVLESEQGGGGTVVGALYTISIDGDIYTIEGSGGTTVIANPSTPATTLLSSLQVSEDVYSVQGFEIVTTLLAGETTLTLTDSKITSDSTFNIFVKDTFGVVMTDISVSGNTLTVEFEEQAEDVDVKVRIT